MTVPAWPDGVRYAPDLNSVPEISRFLPPLETEMGGGNTRRRARPGDNVGAISQTIVMPRAEFAIFVDWVKTTLNNGTSRFSMPVWLGNGFEVKVCQFTKGGLTEKPTGTRSVAVTMSLRIYGL
ncbi:hypothetical protein ACQR13_21030 [Bradyrhizobium sp. HKCCYLRH3059]|uniref:hypothetical protein n=1 Tax=Bradyrhizobium sp. HKCCYLRH3059 TaxID=3420745 RepID=UPI003EB6E51E